MSDLSFTPRWNPAINQLENGEPISAGVAGNANIATRQLAENVFFLRNEASALVIAERDRAVAAETLLTNNLTTEVSRSIGAENQIGESLISLNSAIEAETSRSFIKENQIIASLTSETNRATNKENQIVTNYSAEDTRLNNVIVTEISRATNRENALDAEDKRLANVILQETWRAAVAENDITSRLNSWVSFSHIGPAAPNTTGWKSNDIWLDTSTEI